MLSSITVWDSPAKNPLLPILTNFLYVLELWYITNGINNVKVINENFINCTVKFGSLSTNLINNVSGEITNTPMTVINVPLTWRDNGTVKIMSKVECYWFEMILIVEELICNITEQTTIDNINLIRNKSLWKWW